MICSDSAWGAATSMEEALELEPCPLQTQSINVSTTADALHLANAVRCEGTGSFVVEWFGRVAVGATISVSNGTTLDITSATPGTVVREACRIDAIEYVHVVEETVERPLSVGLISQFVHNPCAGSATNPRRIIPSA